MSTGQARTQRVPLSRDFSAFLVELSIALHKHAMYPEGHPSLPPAAAAVVRRAERLLEDKPLIALGVASRQLIIEGVATDPSQPVLRRLAEALHRHHLGALSVLRGICREEVTGALSALAGDPGTTGPLGLRPRDRLPEWTHLRLHPLTFDRLTLVADAPTGPPASRGNDTSRSAELWIGLARAALAGESTDGTQRKDSAPEEIEPAPLEPAVVARAIEEHPRAEAYDQVIVGYLLQIAQELKESSGAEIAALRRRTARLIAALNPETLRRLVEMGGNVAQRRTFVLDAAHGMAVDAVLEILKAASDVSGQTISQGLVRMLSKLAAHAEIGSDDARPLADAALREQVARLLSGWQLADPNPRAYRQVLQRVTTGAAAETHAMSPEAAHNPKPVRLVQMALEVGGTGPLVERAIDRAVEAGGAAAVLTLEDTLPPGSEPVAQALLGRVSSPAAIAKLTEREPLDIVALDRLMPRMPVESFNPLLDALSTSENRTTRRLLFDRLSQIGRRDIGSLITSRLYDDRWFVQRNMLMLLERSGLAPEGFSAFTWTEHLDPRVRRQAIRLQLTLPREREHALRTALDDKDPRLVHVGLVELQKSCPEDLSGRVIAIAEDAAAREEQRVLAVQALGRCHARAALAALLNLADGGSTLLGRPKLPPRSPLLLAALRALSADWAESPRAKSVLALARQSPDPDVRGAVSRS